MVGDSSDNLSQVVTQVAYRKTESHQTAYLKGLGVISDNLLPLS